MLVTGSSLSSKAFGELAEPGLIVPYQSHQDALRFLSSSIGHANGVALLQGPTGSGKTTVVKQLHRWMLRDTAAAFVEGIHLTPRRLLIDMLSQFGLDTAERQDEELLQMASRFATQHTMSGKTPLLIIDNADRATASALRLLNWLAALDTRGSYVLRIVLSGNEGMSVLAAHNSMRSLVRRHPATYSLNPLTTQEALHYLRTRLIAAGGEDSDKVFSDDVCDRIYELSRGWPGALNERAVEVLDRIEELESARPTPRLILTRDGQTLAEYQLSERRYVIGRSEPADIVIEDPYVSKIHAMLQIYANVILLVDLNSTNGTTVNSRIVERTVLRNNDIISLGRHRLKIENAPAISAEMDERIKASDTATMRTLDDLRLARARRKVKALKHH